MSIYEFGESLTLSLRFLQASQAFVAYLRPLSPIGLWKMTHQTQSGDTAPKLSAGRRVLEPISASCPPFAIVVTPRNMLAELLFSATFPGEGAEKTFSVSWSSTRKAHHGSEIQPSSWILWS
jgi:hypothetical protein